MSKPSDPLVEASDPTTPAARLKELLRGLPKSLSEEPDALAVAIARNPNLAQDDLKLCLRQAHFCLDDARGIWRFFAWALVDNPALDLLLFERPLLPGADSSQVMERFALHLAVDFAVAGGREEALAVLSTWALAVEGGGTAHTARERWLTNLNTLRTPSLRRARTERRRGLVPAPLVKPTKLCPLPRLSVFSLLNNLLKGHEGHHLQEMLGLVHALVPLSNPLGNLKHHVEQRQGRALTSFARLASPRLPALPHWPAHVPTALHAEEACRG